LINLSIASKNRPKNWNQSKSKDQPKLISVFSLTLKVKKPPNMNSLHQMK
jgi:hypothetical protein